MGAGRADRGPEFRSERCPGPPVEQDRAAVVASDEASSGPSGFRGPLGDTTEELTPYGCRTPSSPPGPMKSGHVPPERQPGPCPIHLVAGQAPPRTGPCTCPFRSRMPGGPASAKTLEVPGGVDVGPTHHEEGRLVPPGTDVTSLTRESATAKRAAATVLNVCSGRRREASFPAPRHEVPDKWWAMSSADAGAKPCDKTWVAVAQDSSGPTRRCLTSVDTRSTETSHQSGPAAS